MKSETKTVDELYKDLKMKNTNKLYVFTDSNITNISNKAGSRTISELLPEEITSVIKYKLDNVCKFISLYQQYYGSNITAIMVSYAMQDAKLPHMFTDDLVDKECKETNFSPKLKPNTKAIKNIRFTQRQYSCLYLSKTTFARIFVQQMRDYITDFSIETDAIILLQYGIEKYIINILNDATVIMISRGNEELSPIDIQTARRLRGDRY